MGRSRTTKSGRLAGLGKTTLSKYKQICDVLGNPHGASCNDGTDMDDKLCFFWLSEGSVARHRLARVVKQHQVAVIKRHLSTTDRSGSGHCDEEHNLRVHLYQPRDALPGCQRVDWRHHLCVDKNVVSVEGGLIGTDDGALLLALLYFDSGGHFLRKDAPAAPSSQLHTSLGADLGRLLAAVVDIEVRNAAASSGALSHRSELLPPGVQRSRQFQRHKDSLLSERRQRASSISEWLASLDSKRRAGVLSFRWEAEMVMNKCDVSLGNKPLLHLSSHGSAVEVAIAYSTVQELLLQSFDLATDDSAVLAVTSAAHETGGSTLVGEDTTKLEEACSSSSPLENQDTRKLTEAVDPEMVKLLVSSAQQHLMSEWSSMADQEAKQHAENLLQELEKEKGKMSIDHDASLVKTAKGGKKKKKVKVPRLVEAIVPNVIRRKEPDSNELCTATKTVTDSCRQTFFLQSEKGLFPASEPLVMDNSSAAVPTHDGSVDSCIGSSRSVSPANSLLELSSCSTSADTRCRRSSWLCDDSEADDLPSSKCHCGAEAVFCGTCSYLSTSLPSEMSGRCDRAAEESPEEDEPCTVQSQENEWITAVPRSRRLRKAPSDCPSPRLKKKTMTRNAVRSVSTRQAPTHCMRSGKTIGSSVSSQSSLSVEKSLKGPPKGSSQHAPKITGHVVDASCKNPPVSSMLDICESTNSVSVNSYASKARQGLKNELTGVFKEPTAGNTAENGKCVIENTSQQKSLISERKAKRSLSLPNQSKKTTHLAESSTQTDQVSVEPPSEPDCAGAPAPVGHQRDNGDHSVNLLAGDKEADCDSQSRHHLMQAPCQQQEKICSHCAQSCTNTPVSACLPVQPSPPLHCTVTSCSHWAASQMCLPTSACAQIPPNLTFPHACPPPRQAWSNCQTCNLPHLNGRYGPEQIQLYRPRFQPSAQSVPCVVTPRAQQGILNRSPVPVHVLKPFQVRMAAVPPVQLTQPSPPLHQVQPSQPVQQAQSSWQVVIPQPSIVCSPTCLRDICCCVEEQLASMTSAVSLTGVVTASVAYVVAKSTSLREILARAHAAPEEWSTCVIAAVSGTSNCRLWLEVAGSEWLVSMAISQFR